MPRSATLILGERDAVLVDAFLTDRAGAHRGGLTRRFSFTAEQLSAGFPPTLFGHHINRWKGLKRSPVVERDNVVDAQSLCLFTLLLPDACNDECSFILHGAYRRTGNHFCVVDITIRNIVL